MKIRTKMIPIAFAKEGMKLAATLESNEGLVLLVAGTELSDRSLSSLLRRNVCSVAIEEVDTRSESELLNERNKTTERINTLFSQAPPSKNMQILHQVILEYRLEPLL
jgi:hypothetical protein